MEHHERKKELEEIIKRYGEETAEMTKNLVENVIFLENRLCELKKLPFLKMNESNPVRQKATAASKQYKDVFQQYTNALKILMGITKAENDDKESPLRVWAAEYKRYLQEGAGDEN